ncbi:MAG: hypothetical protein AB2693_17670, partial [Candidatus Thiodiazotropha sp.]
IQQWPTKPVGYLGKNILRKKSRRVTRAVLDLYDGRENVRKKQNEAGANKYRKANKKVQTAPKKQKRIL